MKKKIVHWLKDVSLRCIKTMSQVAATYFVLDSTNKVAPIDSRALLYAVAVAGISCLLMNLSNIGE